MKVLISGGGTGGHVFPAIAIADALRSMNPHIELLFVGAMGKLEMTKVPEAGYPILGLDIRGFKRKWSVENVKTIWKLLKSLMQSKKILDDFKPNAVVGVGGYASGPILRVAAWKKIPILIQEQNSYAGITNKLMALKAQSICVAFDGMEKFFPFDKIRKTGNPVRSEFTSLINRSDAFHYYGFQSDKKTLCVFGGSLGAKSINEAMLHFARQIMQANDLQVLWQVGKNYQHELADTALAKAKNVRMISFIERMDYAYEIADLVVSRAGALTLAEMAALGKACILIPSPNVAEDHQRKNAQAMVNQNAAKLILDKEIKEKLWNEVEEMLHNEKCMLVLRENIRKFSNPEAANEIAREVIRIAV